jgi:transcriptional regulator with XRE-family HTH domain
MDKNLILFAKKLKKLRKKRHLTLEKISELTDVSPNHILKLEGGRANPSFSLISRLSEALNVEIKELFNFDDLQPESYIKDEFLKLINFSDEKHLQTLYKIHKDLIN